MGSTQREYSHNMRVGSIRHISRDGAAPLGSVSVVSFPGPGAPERRRPSAPPSLAGPSPGPEVARDRRIRGPDLLLLRPPPQVTASSGLDLLAAPPPPASPVAASSGAPPPSLPPSPAAAGRLSLVSCLHPPSSSAAPAPPSLPHPPPSAPPSPSLPRARRPPLLPSAHGEGRGGAGATQHLAEAEQRSTRRRRSGAEPPRAHHAERQGATEE